MFDRACGFVPVVDRVPLPATTYYVLEQMAIAEEVEEAAHQAPYNCPLCRKPQLTNVDHLQVCDIVHTHGQARFIKQRTRSWELSLARVQACLRDLQQGAADHCKSFTEMRKDVQTDVSQTCTCL